MFKLIDPRLPAVRRNWRISVIYIRAAAVVALAAAIFFAGLNQPDVVKAGTPVQVTVRILRVIEIHCDEGVGVPCPNDPYVKVNIANQGLQDSARYDSNADFTPYDWVFSRTV